MRTFIVLSVLLGAAGCAGVGTKPTPQPRTVQAEDVRFGAQGRGYLARPEGGPPAAGVVALHGEYGLTDTIKAHARRLAGKGYVVLAVDLYRGKTAADLEEAHILSRGLRHERAMADVKAAVDFLSARPDVRADAVGVIGWDMGGGYALDAAVADPRLKAVVNCYGRVKTDAAALKGLQGKVLGLFAGKSEGISRETLEKFRRALREAGRPGEAHVYPEREHMFMNPPSDEAPDPAAAADVEDAWGRVERFFAQELRP